jgi:2-polyprenyl-3-methyl-5-hydroxy-6-metoxy-1,4-benzoquinol methylase
MKDAVTFHNKLAHGWDDRYARRSFQRREVVVAKLLAGTDLKSRSWLDAGCGSGRLSRLLAQCGANVLGVDAASHMLESAVRLAEPIGVGERPRFQRVEDIASLPFGPASFDGILCISVLEYLPDPIGCLSEFARLLRPDGTLLVSIPNTASQLRRAQWALFALSRLLGHTGFPAYLRYSHDVTGRAGFETALRAAGFTPDGCQYLGGPWPATAQSWPWLGSLIMFRARRRNA